jgi:hypothetical protein
MLMKINWENRETLDLVREMNNGVAVRIVEIKIKISKVVRYKKINSDMVKNSPTVKLATRSVNHRMRPFVSKRWRVIFNLFFS